VAARKAFLLRVDPAVLEAVQRWADDDLRSLNAQIEYLLRAAVRQAGRLRDPATATSAPARSGEEPPPDDPPYT
jgi:hypothetical protein